MVDSRWYVCIHTNNTSTVLQFMPMQRRCMYVCMYDTSLFQPYNTSNGCNAMQCNCLNRKL